MQPSDDQIDRLIRPLPGRPAEEPLPTLADIIEAWRLEWPLRQAVEEIASAATIPAVGETARATRQTQALKRAFGFCLQAHRGIGKGIIISQPPRMAKASIRPDQACDILGLSHALANALRAIFAATKTTLPDEQKSCLEEAMAALNTGISIREAVK